MTERLTAKEERKERFIVWTSGCRAWPDQQPRLPVSVLLHRSSFILLELMLLRMNIRKRDAMGERQQALAQRLRSAGLF